MFDHYKESRFPDNYRQHAVACIVQALAIERSVQVAGLTGMGKSNILRFLVSHPQLIANSMGAANKAIRFIHIDCNRLNPMTLANFYRECHLQLQADTFESAELDSYAAYKQVEADLRALEPQTYVIFVIDRVEYLLSSVSADFFNQLRSLRDEARYTGHLAFVLSSRRGVAILYELAKLFSDICWIGPLVEADKSAIFEKHMARLSFAVSDDWQQTLWRLSGGHPGFLKNSLEWLRRGQHPPMQDADIIASLLDYQPIARYCEHLWHDLTESEQRNVSLVGQGVDCETGILRQMGLITGNPTSPNLFSPLWQAYLETHIWSTALDTRLHLEIDSVTHRVVLQWRHQTTEINISRALVFKLLQVLAASPGQIKTKEDLIQAIYPDEKSYEVFDDALFQLISSLRKTLDAAVKRIYPSATESCIQNLRGVGYKLVLDLPISERD